ncbi:MAG: hypothetical protein FJW46_05535 [Actinobacteria bacterium]|nr:hypothetical protein [Actinomycetota bacterium]
MSAPIWMNPETTSVNRLPMINLRRVMTVSLHGEWNFQLLDNPDQDPSRRWRTIPVPRLWTIVDGKQPFGDKPIYTNVQMPFDELPPNFPTENPKRNYFLGLPSNWRWIFRASSIS